MNKVVNKFISERYHDIILMSKKICRSSKEYEEVGHFSIESFMTHERAEELIEAGKGMNFLSGIIHRSFHSSTSQYHTLIRQKNRMHSLPLGYENKADVNVYDVQEDYVIEAIQGVLEDMKADGINLWYRATLFEMHIKTPNYSEISRNTGIPRTSISQAVEEARTYIQTRLINNNITL